MTSQIIDQYEKGGEKLRYAISGMSREDVTWMPTDPVLGRWSIQEVVIHCMDSDLISTDRMKRLAAEENPLLIGYDENKFSRALHYHDQSMEDAITVLDLNRRNFARVLRKLPPEAFARTGVHNERGKVNLGDYVKHVVQHLDRHIDFIHRKRAALNKPVKD